MGKSGLGKAIGGSRRRWIMVTGPYLYLLPPGDEMAPHPNRVRIVDRYPWPLAQKSNQRRRHKRWISIGSTSLPVNAKKRLNHSQSDTSDATAEQSRDALYEPPPISRFHLPDQN